MTNVLITGASGFVGRSLLARLALDGYNLRATYHHSRPVSSANDNSSITWTRYDLGSDTNNLDILLDGIDVVIHLAAHVHVMSEYDDNLEPYRKINTRGTRRLAEEAGKRGIKRFIFISTAKVHGEKTRQYPDGRYQCFTELDQPAASGPYAISKLEAENEIKDICNKSSMEYLILRPPLIYGPGVKANFKTLIRIIENGYPLPFSSIKNQRSMLYVENLGHAVMTCIKHPKAANQTYLISDSSISVPELVRMISFHMHIKPKLFPCPVWLLKMAGWLTGKSAMTGRLTDSFLLDNSKLINEIHWHAPIDMEEGLRRTINWYIESRAISTK